MTDDLARTVAFERWLHRRLATRTEPFSWGTAYLDDRFPKRWDSNFLWVERRLAGVSGEALAAEADRVLGGVGLAHREILVDDEGEGVRLMGELSRLGYEHTHLLTMALRREPDRRSEIPTEEVDAATLRPTLEILLRREPWGDDEEAVQQLADYRRVLAERIGARFFVARSGNEIGSICELYADGRVAQVEDVHTLQEFRGRGLARAVVLRAIAEARADRHRLVFLHADIEDWPSELYAKLGFDAIGSFWSFVHPPGKVVPTQQGVPT